MPDPWLNEDELKAHEEEVANHPLTKEAEKVREQDAQMRKEFYEGKIAELSNDDSEADPIRPASDTGVSQEAASGGTGPLGDAAPPEPAGNVDSNEPTVEEQQAGELGGEAHADGDQHAGCGL